MSRVINPRSRTSSTPVCAMRWALWALLLCVLWQGLLLRASRAQGIIQGATGYLDLNYDVITSEVTDATGRKVKTVTDSFNRRLGLDINTNIFPNVRLRTGGIFEQTTSNIDGDGTDTKTTTTNSRPYIDFIFTSPVYTVDLGYLRQEEKVKTSGSPTLTLVNEQYNAFYSWKPEGLPIFDGQVSRIDTYSRDRSLLDIQEDLMRLNSRYVYKGLDLYYQGTYDRTKDKVNDLETKTLIHNGRVSYTNRFFDNRVSLQTTYNIARQEVETTAGGSGAVGFQVFPFAGLSVITNTPSNGALDPNPALIDGNTAASAGINLGLPPVGGDTRPRNVGLDLLNATDVNRLMVWVDIDLPSTIANSFSWQIWTSSDNLNWTLRSTVSPAPFGPFDHRFEVNFPTVNARYIKVVTSPLSATVPGSLGYPNIFITELQAFINRPAQDVTGKTTQTAQIFNLGSKTSLLNDPSLFYEFYTDYNRVDPDGLERYVISNGFSASHRFSRIFSGTARFAREDGEDRDEKTEAYVYYAALTADPLKTLHNNLVFSGLNQKIGGRPNNSNGVILYNTAQLYKGIDLNLNGGVTLAEDEEGQKTRTFLLNPVVNVIPHRALNLNFFYVGRKTTRSGNVTGDSSETTDSYDLNVTYQPLRTVYLSSLWQVVIQDGERETLQNYGINWSPFQDGALQFNFSYNELINSSDNGKERTIVPSLRWNITKRSYLDVSYQITRDKSDSGKTDITVFSTSLHLYF
jgi:hypothetical protein